MTLVDTVRWATVVLSALTVLVGTPQWPRWYRDCTAEQWQGLLALALLNTGVGYGTWEALHRGVVGGPRSYVVAVGILFTFYRIAWHPTERAITRYRERTHHRAQLARGR